MGVTHSNEAHGGQNSGKMAILDQFGPKTLRAHGPLEDERVESEKTTLPPITS